MNLKDKTIAQLAGIIRQDWARPYFGARPYLTAMLSLNSIYDDYGYDSGTEVVRYFLSNARQWKGEVARAVKAELKERAGIK